MALPPLHALVGMVARAAAIDRGKARKAVLRVLEEVVSDLDAYVMTLADTDLRDAARVVRERMQVAIDRVAQRSADEWRADRRGLGVAKLSNACASLASDSPGWETKAEA